jgi:RND family efflux transporter MFP subunit
VNIAGVLQASQSRAHGQEGHGRARRCGCCRRGAVCLAAARRERRCVARRDLGAGVVSVAAAGPPVSVTTIVVQKKDVDVMLEATGTVTALNSVDIRPQIASTITKVQIKEGQFVSAGQPLFLLDARNDEVNVTKARAQLAKDQAALADAERQLARSKDLFAQNFISQGAVDTNQTLVESARAVVAADRAAIESAQVGLSYSRIVAPAAGRAGAINVFPGSSVQPPATRS